MKRSLFLLLLGLLPLSHIPLSARATDTNADTPLIEKNAHIHHKKWFFRFQVQRPTVSFPPPTIALFGHFQVSLRDPSEKIIYSQKFSMQHLSSTSPTVHTIKIPKPIKGLYTLYVTLLDRNNDNGAFDATPVNFASSYFLNAQFFDNKNMKINVPSIAPFMQDIALATDPSVVGQTVFSLHIP